MSLPPIALYATTRCKAINPQHQGSLSTFPDLSLMYSCRRAKCIKKGESMEKLAFSLWEFSFLPLSFRPPSLHSYVAEWMWYLIQPLPLIAGVVFQDWNWRDGPKTEHRRARKMRSRDPKVGSKGGAESSEIRWCSSLKYSLASSLLKTLSSN